MILRKREIPSILMVQKIWDQAPHQSMTDLIYFNDRWFCVFRESDSHAFGKEGIIRLICSFDGLQWQSVTTFSENGIDLRDPKLSEMPDGRLMLLVGGSQYEGRKYISRQSRVAFSLNGLHWSSFHLILKPHEWLWRVTWNQHKAYGISYSFSNPLDLKQELVVKLFESLDGIHYDLVCNLEVSGRPSEGTIGFSSNEEMTILLRREQKQDNYCWIGHSISPYTEWKWGVASYHVGGPHFIIMPDDKMWAAGRLLSPTPYGLIERTALLHFKDDSLQPSLILPSGGDTGYPGLVFRDGLLWISYYSSHEGKASIYLARIFFSH